MQNVLQHNTNTDAAIPAQVNDDIAIDTHDQHADYWKNMTANKATLAPYYSHKHKIRRFKSTAGRVLLIAMGLGVVGLMLHGMAN